MSTSSIADLGRKIASLKKKLIRRRKQNLQYVPLSSSNKQEAITTAVPKGYLPVYVGDECNRYVIPVKYLALSNFQILLEQSTDDEDDDAKVDGPLILRHCSPKVFEEVLDACHMHR